MSNVHPIDNSTGIAIAQRPDKGEPGDNHASFRVTKGGKVVDLGGWGYAGPLPSFGSLINVPPNPLTIHTVVVEDDGEPTRQGLREIIDGHVERYGETQVYVGQGVGPGIVNWARIGCPAERGAPTDAELALMHETEILGRDDHFYETSEPNPAVDEHDAGTIPTQLEQERAAVAHARQAAGASHPTARHTGEAGRAADAKTARVEAREASKAAPAEKQASKAAPAAKSAGNKAGDG